MSSIGKFLVLSFLVCTNLFAQSPNQFKYQAVLRDGNGAVLANASRTVIVRLLQGSTIGQVVFEETHAVATSEFGLINLNIGSLEGSTLAAVDWSAGPYFIRILVDGVEMGTSQLLSVPFAIQSRYAEISNYNALLNKPTLFSGSYNDLTGKPSLFSGSYNDLTNKPTLFSGSYNDLTGKPSLFSGSYNDLTNKPTKIADLALDAAGEVITNVATPGSPTDAATKAYVDALMEKLLSLQAELGARDAEGYVYRAVKIGAQVWMAENLRTTKYNDGTPIDNVTDNNTWGTLATPAYSWYNNDEATYKHPYGAMYNLHAVETGKLCPLNYHVPTLAEWLILENFLGGIAVAGGHLKETGTAHWVSPNTGATNSSGFTAVPGGTRSGDSAPGFAGVFGNVGSSGAYWTSTPFDGMYVYKVVISATSAQVYNLDDPFKRHGFSIRCVHD